MLNIHIWMGKSKKTMEIHGEKQSRNIFKVYIKLPPHIYRQISTISSHHYVLWTEIILS